MYKPDLSDQKVTDFVGLRCLCIRQMWLHPTEDWSGSELLAIGRMMKDYTNRESLEGRYVNADWRDNEGLSIINRDLAELGTQIPKWASLVSWLAPESAAQHAPAFVAQLAQLALSKQLTSYESVVEREGR